MGTKDFNALDLFICRWRSGIVRRFIRAGDTVLDFGCGHQALAFRCRAEALDLTGITPEDIPRHMAKAFCALGDVQALLNMKF